MSLRADDCVIVSMGCFLPGATNVPEYWDLVLNNKCQIKPIGPKRWKKEINYSPYREQPDKTYSYYAAEIDNDIYLNFRKKWFGENSENISRMDIMGCEALDQAKKGINLPSPDRVSLILGAMNPDERYFVTRFKSSVPVFDEMLKEMMEESKHADLKELLIQYADKFSQGFVEKTEDLMSTSVLHRLKQRFEIKGRSYIVDAACAAGIASIDLGMSYLKNKTTDFVFVGGLESNLGPGTFVLFSKVGALSDERCLPFDKKSKGLSQGEGAVIFGLQRYEDAIAMGNPILAVVRGVGASSDGKVASLFQPDIGGQLLALKRAYTEVESHRVDYVELHGTGTQVGDYTECESVSVFYKNFEIPVGAVKSLIGHAKATAGAAGVLKCLLAIQHRILPGTDYANESIFEKSDLFLNKEPIRLKNTEHLIKCGISAFGFGGTNFHLLLEEVKDQKIALPDAKKSSDSFGAKMSSKENSFAANAVAILGEFEVGFDQFSEAYFTDKTANYKLPPKSLKYIDRTQLMGVYAVDQLLKQINLPLTQYHRDLTHVFSASTLGLDIIDNLACRIALDTIIEGIDRDPIEEGTEEERALIRELSECLKDIKSKFIAATEESGPGVLNNVIAGRVCNAFNFRGKNLNIDSDVASVEAATEAICEDIRAGKNGLFLLVGVEESIDPLQSKIIRERMKVSAYSSLAFARDNFLEVKSVLEFS